MATDNLFSKINNWRVIEDFTGSDHQYIVFDVGGTDNCKLTSQKVTTPRWNLEKMDRAKFNEILEQGQFEIENLDESLSAKTLADSTMLLISRACEASIPPKGLHQNRLSNYWWTDEIAVLRKACLKSRREMLRAKTSHDRERKSIEHKTEKNKLKKAINKSKSSCWKKLCEEVNNDPWGQSYKIITRKFGVGKEATVLEPEAMKNIVDALFPTHPPRLLEESHDIDEVPLFSLAELREAAATLKKKKAPGPDGIQNEILEIIIESNPTLLLNMFNACLIEGVFHVPWKTARLVLISKKKGDPALPSSNRPLSMLDTAGKLLEKLVKKRLTEAIEQAGDLSKHQYGFRPKKCTIDAILEVVEAVQSAENHNPFSRRIVLLVTLDVKNAFNTLRWTDILDTLVQDFGVPKYLTRLISDYLKERFVIYDTTEGPKLAEVTAGVAQGSILGPNLWNCTYNSLLNMEMPEECKLVGYADDVAALVAARSTELAQLKLNQVMRKIQGWMQKHGLTLALEKTEIVILTKKNIDTIIPMLVGDENIMTKPSAKYLGLIMDNKLNYSEQLNSAADKAAKSVTTLSSIMANIGGPKASKRKLLMSTVNSIILYGAEIWAGQLEKGIHSHRIMQVQKRSAVRIASAYRTVSIPAVLVIAGVIPINLMARERQTIFIRKRGLMMNRIKDEERERTMKDWQESWDQENRGRWTARLIKSIKQWVDRNHGEVNYYITQLLSGHGYFRSYLYKMGKTASHDCLYCPGAYDNAEHTFFACERFTNERKSIEKMLGAFSPETAVESIILSEDNWNAVSRYVEEILKMKKIDLERLN